MPEPSTPEVAQLQADPFAVALFNRYADNGPNREYQELESRIATAGSGRKRASNLWKFVEDAVTGGGGFSNGAYLFPHKAELENGKLTDKLARRQEQADYENFAGDICSTPFDIIVSGSDMIERKVDEGSKAAPLLSAFWADCDSRGTAILDFLDYPFHQGRKFGTGWIFIDRPAVDLKTNDDNLKRENRPYLYAVPTQLVVDWKFDEEGNLLGVVVLEPGDDAGPDDLCPVRVWTRTSWAVFTPLQGKKARKASAYVLTEVGENLLGEVPAVPFFNTTPERGKGLGTTEMIDVARAAQTVYNIDSEAREIERKCALFLAMPVKNVSEYAEGKVVIGTDSVMLYDGEAGAPAWISPDLDILERLDKRRELKKDGAYAMAHIRAIVGNIQTESGFHAEVEFSKTERRISRFASNLEQVEKRLYILFLKFYAINAQDDPDLFSVTYPRDFGVRDVEKLIARTKELLGLNLGEEFDREIVVKLAKGMFPRATEERIQKMVDASIKRRSDSEREKSSIERIRAMADRAGKPELPVPAGKKAVVPKEEDAA